MGAYGDEVVLHPLVVVECLDGVLLSAADRHRGVREIGELRGRVVAPDDHALHLARRDLYRVHETLDALVPPSSTPRPSLRLRSTVHYGRSKQTMST